MKLILIAISILIHNMLFAQASSYKFDLGTGLSAKGYISITPDSKYNDSLGYGFDAGSQLRAIDRGGKSPERDFITSSEPFYFSVRLPEGNYDVKLILGDFRQGSATTVRTENRRLMIENARTSNGTFTSNITIHIRDSMIRNQKGEVISKVRLKPREHSYLHWDNLLTFEFNDSLPKIAAIEITPDKNATTIFLAGNSTVVDQDREPWAAWGQIFPRFFVADKIAVANYAESGETLKAFKGEKRLDKIWSMAKPGDYLFIEFTHNDQKPGGNHLDPFTTYKQTLKEWIAEARKRSIIPVLVTSMHRRNFDSTGHIINTLAEYPDAMRQTAAEENVVLIDLNAMSKQLYEALGPQNSQKAFVHYPANTFPNQPEELKDNTHFSPYGAYQLALCVVASLIKQQHPLAKYLRSEAKAFDPSKPVRFENFYWPPATLKAVAKPDGN